MLKHFFSALLVSALALSACSDDDQHPLATPSVVVSMPANLADVSVVSQSITLTNVTTGEVISLDSFDGLSCPDGVYDVNYRANVSYSVSESMGDSVAVSRCSGVVVASANSVSFVGASSSLSLATSLLIDSDDFIFQEIFFTGTLRPSGSQYIGTQYFRIYNNTDHVLYADGLAFCESKFTSTLYFSYVPNIRADTMTVQAIYVIPGSGSDHPVQPGGSLIICDTGIDHRDANSNAFDLSNADFEWYDESSKAAYMDIDSPTVPNLDKWYCYTETIFVLHNRGFKSYALARIPAGLSKEDYLSEFYYTYDYVNSSAAGAFDMSASAYKIPNSWIVDGVNCSVESVRLWNILPASVDAGWTHCGTIDKDATRYFRSVRRKVDYITDDGIVKLKDSNNSSDDFNTECIPSLIEEQGTAIDAEGTPASSLTYDGQLAR